MPAPAKDMIGFRAGRLLVVRRSLRRAGSVAWWDCDCDCGGSKCARGYSLRRGDVNSCGCIIKESAWDHPRKHSTPEDAAWNFNYKQYIRNVRHRKLEMTLTLDEFKGICKQDCVYCGLPPEVRPSQRGRASIHSSGIDRVDNSLGYIDGNVVACCTWCNRAKGAHSVEDFLENCKRVANASIARNE